MFRFFNLLPPFIDGYPKEVIRCAEKAWMFFVVTIIGTNLGEKTFNHGELRMGTYIEKESRLVIARG